MSKSFASTMLCSSIVISCCKLFVMSSPQFTGSRISTDCTAGKQCTKMPAPSTTSDLWSRAKCSISELREACVETTNREVGFASESTDDFGVKDSRSYTFLIMTQLVSSTTTKNADKKSRRHGIRDLSAKVVSSGARDRSRFLRANYIPLPPKWMPHSLLESGSSWLNQRQRPARLSSQGLVGVVQILHPMLVYSMS